MNCTEQREGMKSIIWCTVDSADDERLSWKQHAYVPSVRRIPYIGDIYNGNRTLCNKRFGIMEDERFVDIKDIKPEVLNTDEVCKKCLNIFRKLEEKIEK